jgi:hypothetical protein
VRTPKKEQNIDLKIWCESCHIRVGSNEQKIVANGKTYHSRCYAKLNAKPGMAENDGGQKEASRNSKSGQRA